MTSMRSNAHRVEIVAAPDNFLLGKIEGMGADEWLEVGDEMLMINGSGQTVPLDYFLLDESPGGGESLTAYGGKAGYSHTLQVLRYVGNGAGTPPPFPAHNDLKPIEYNLATNIWSRPTDRPFAGFFGGHGFDHTFADSDTGMIFTKMYGKWNSGATFSGWNGSTWNQNIITGMEDSGMGTGEFMHGIDYDSYRQGVWVCSRGHGADFWRKSDNTWPVGDGVYRFHQPTYFGGVNELHWTAVFNHYNNWMWFIGPNTQPYHWRLSPTNVFSNGVTPPWNSFGGHGGEGKIHVFDPRSGKMLTCDPGDALNEGVRRAYLYDIAATTDSFQRVADWPRTLSFSAGAVSGTWVGLPAPYNIVLLLMSAGAGNRPECWLYKSVAVPVS